MVLRIVHCQTPLQTCYARRILELSLKIHNHKKLKAHLQSHLKGGRCFSLMAMVMSHAAACLKSWISMKALQQTYHGVRMQKRSTWKVTGILDAYLMSIRSWVYIGLLVSHVFDCFTEILHFFLNLAQIMFFFCSVGKLLTWDSLSLATGFQKHIVLQEFVLLWWWIGGTPWTQRTCFDLLKESSEWCSWSNGFFQRPFRCIQETPWIWMVCCQRSYLGVSMVGFFGSSSFGHWRPWGFTLWLTGPVMSGLLGVGTGPLGTNCSRGASRFASCADTLATTESRTTSLGALFTFLVAILSCSFQRGECISSQWWYCWSYVLLEAMDGVHCGFNDRCGRRVSIFILHIAFWLTAEWCQNHPSGRTDCGGSGS